jgi:hypothetical protein
MQSHATHERESGRPLLCDSCTCSIFLESRILQHNDILLQGILAHSSPKVSGVATAFAATDSMCRTTSSHVKFANQGTIRHDTSIRQHIVVRKKHYVNSCRRRFLASGLVPSDRNACVRLYRQFRMTMHGDSHQAYSLTYSGYSATLKPMRACDKMSAPLPFSID